MSEELKDMTSVISTVLKYAEYVRSEDYHEDNDWQYNIYEAAVEAVLGEEFWEEIINKKLGIKIDD